MASVALRTIHPTRPLVILRKALIDLVGQSHPIIGLVNIDHDFKPDRAGHCIAFRQKEPDNPGHGSSLRSAMADASRHDCSVG
jgi:hypothetical protein